MTVRSLFFLVTLLGVSPVHAGQQQESLSSLAERARNGETAAVREMGQSGDAQAVPILLRLFHDPEYRVKRDVRLALAKLGERDAVQYFACRSLTGSVRQINDLIRGSLDYIGGDFSIEIYRQLLDSDQRFLPDMERTDRNSDALLTFPSSVALVRLSELIPDVGIPNPSPLAVQAGKDGEFKKRWATWIGDHEEQLGKIAPTAEEIVFDSSYCSDFTNTAAMDRRLRMISGDGADNCGSAGVGVNAAKVDSCVRREFGGRKAFVVRYDVHDVDEDEAVGLASDGRGSLYAIAFDDAGVSTLGLGDKAELFDGRHVVVVPCPKPIQFRQSVSKGLTCLTQRGNRLLSPE
jgi:hypothetical protein